MPQRLQGNTTEIVQMQLEHSPSELTYDFRAVKQTNSQNLWT